MLYDYVLSKEASALTPRDENIIAAWWGHQPRKGDLLSSDGEILWLHLGGAKIPAAEWTGRYSYKFSVLQGVRAMDRVREAVEEWESYHPMVRPRLRNSPMTPVPQNFPPTQSLRSRAIHLASVDAELRPLLLEVLGGATKVAAKAPKAAPKLKGKKLDDAISAAYYRHGKGVQINIMDITKIYDAGKKAYEAAATVEEADKALDEAMQAAISQFRKN